MMFKFIDPIDSQLLLTAYASGLFPMGMEDGSIGWFSPDPRGVLPLDDGFHVSRSLAKTVAREKFEIRVDSAFVEVMEACAERQETWINEVILRSYAELFAMGHAHCVEAWNKGRMVGGLYGVSVGGAFFGESMFSRERDASKVCLVHLVERLRRGGYELLDVQWNTPHLERFGAREIGREEYMMRLEQALAVDARWDGRG